MIVKEATADGAFSNLYFYIRLFEKDGTIICQNYNERLCQIINHEKVETNLKTELDGIIPYIQVNSTNRLTYQLSEEFRPVYNDPCGCIGFWFISKRNFISQFLIL